MRLPRAFLCSFLAPPAAAAARNFFREGMSVAVARAAGSLLYWAGLAGSGSVGPGLLAGLGCAAGSGRPDLGVWLGFWLGSWRLAGRLLKLYITDPGFDNQGSIKDTIF